MKASKYDLRASFNYLRLAFQSMSKDQAEAARAVAELGAEAEEHLETVEEQLFALAQLVARKTTKLVEGNSAR